MTPAQSLLRSATGLNLSKAVVDRAIKNRMEQTGIGDAETYLQQMQPEELTALVELVVVPESWFYRDPQAFYAMSEFLRARLAADSGRLARILSIPCAGGEEPYSMAMVLTDAGIPPDNFMIDAFDISPTCVARAKSGIYGRNAFRAQDLSFRERHFSSAGDGDYRINDSIRKQVRFKQGNLLEFDLSARSGYYDVVFCRNLLIYFDKPTTKAAIAKLEALLADDGQLFAGYAEVPSFCQHGFAPLQYNQAFGLQKEAAAPHKPPRAARPPAKQVAPRAVKPAPTPAPVSRSRATPSRVAPAARPATDATAGANPAPAVDLLAEARRLADLGDIKAAERHCRDHLAQHPEAAEAYFILGLLNELTNKPKMAEDYWKRCIYLQPDHYEALCHLALLAEANQDASGAAALKARAARIYKRQQAS
ncbi:methyltransferase domain-containing protein [Duganella sp. FT80W]|uniref:Methyltransferase domain-containing protein n=1 Tax=Duganella guangzhouensis TaxID=2666084 RepID=A0A6I2LA06_9BURK|nr:protein-glutamate O-methyltransferase CheR [Duganella guangzhouensis]MRW94552.1 methyltransferase domain-containing protein [Duganella guangzhouensis]